MKRQSIRKAIILVSFLLFPVTIFYLSPYLIIMGAGEGIVTGSFLLFGALFFLSLFFGRAFCAWVCPAAGLQEACAAVNDAPVRKGNWLKYVFWAPWLAGIATAAIGAGGLWRIEPLYQTTHGISVAAPGAYIIYYGILLLFLILSFAVGRRSFCHHACWIAPFMVLGRKLRNLFGWPALRLRARPELCGLCGSCSKQCPMSLEVQEMVAAAEMERAECILCGDCADGCPRGAISYAWRLEKRVKAAKRDKTAAG